MFLGYAYVSAHDVVPMNSSVAFTNFVNVALNDINNPVAGVSDYRVPHRFTLRASFGHDFFGNSETRFTLYGVLSEGQPGSYVMSSEDLEGDGSRDPRHLLYVPTGPEDPNVVFGPDFDTSEFFAFVDREGFNSGFLTRNARHARWTKRIDFRVDQEFPTGGETRGRVYLKMYNVGNFVSEDWGNVWDAEFNPVEKVDAGVNDAGQYVFNRFSDRDISDLVEGRSQWEVRIGVGFRF
jgi:hypothetical protein